MNEVIIYEGENNTVGLIKSFSRTKTLQEVAEARFTNGETYKFVDESTLPSFTFFDAWVYGPTITINFDKAKDVAHTQRRIARNMEMKPYDDIVAKQIPSEVETAEAQRALIRTKYATKQTEIDACTTVDELQTIIDEFRG